MGATSKYAASGTVVWWKPCGLTQFQQTQMSEAEESIEAWSIEARRAAKLKQHYVTFTKQQRPLQPHVGIHSVGLHVRG